MYHIYKMDQTCWYLPDMLTSVRFCNAMGMCHRKVRHVVLKREPAENLTSLADKFYWQYKALVNTATLGEFFIWTFRENTHCLRDRFAELAEIDQDPSFPHPNVNYRNGKHYVRIHESTLVSQFSKKFLMLANITGRFTVFHLRRGDAINKWMPIILSTDKRLFKHFH